MTSNPKSVHAKTPIEDGVTETQKSRKPAGGAIKDLDTGEGADPIGGARGVAVGIIRF